MSGAEDDGTLWAVSIGAQDTEESRFYELTLQSVQHDVECDA